MSQPSALPTATQDDLSAPFTQPMPSSHSPEPAVSQANLLPGNHNPDGMLPGTLIAAISLFVIVLVLTGALLFGSWDPGTTLGSGIMHAAQSDFNQHINEHGAPIIISLTLLLSLAGYFAFNYYWWRQASRKRLAHLDQEEADMKTLVYDSSSLNEEVRQAFNVTWQSLHNGRCFHRGILLISTSYQYALLSTLQVSSFGAGLVTFILLPVGWQGSSANLQAAFLTLSAVATYCGVSTRLLRHDQHIAVNLERYHAYRLLQQQCYDYLTTTPPDTLQLDTVPAAAVSAPADATPLIIPRRFLHVIHTEMQKIPTFLFGLDASQIKNPTQLASEMSAGAKSK